MHYFHNFEFTTTTQGAAFHSFILISFFPVRLEKLKRAFWPWAKSPSINTLVYVANYTIIHVICQRLKYISEHWHLLLIIKIALTITHLNRHFQVRLTRKTVDV